MKTNEKKSRKRRNYHINIIMLLVAWIYINYQGANTNSSYSEYTPLLKLW